MDQQLIEQLACYLGDRILSARFGHLPSKDDIAGMIADFFTESGVPHKDALTAALLEIKPVKHSDDWNPYDASGGNFDDAYEIGVRDGESQLAAELRDLLGINDDAD